MARVKIANYDNLIEVSQATAKVVKNTWLDDKIAPNTPVEVSPTLTVEKRAIKAVFLDGETNPDLKGYDINNPEQKEIVRSFERELGDLSFHEYCSRNGFYTGEPPREIMNEYKLREYEDAKRKYNALQSLKHSRKLAKQHEESGMLESLKPEMEQIGKMPETTGTTEPKFQYQKEQDEIRIEDIPF